jgi:hypothetical protein
MNPFRVILYAIAGFIAAGTTITIMAMVAPGFLPLIPLTVAWWAKPLVDTWDEGLRVLLERGV